MDALINFFMEPLTYNFIQRGLLALILVGGISAVIGCFVVVRGLSFFGDALAHSVLPGVALSYTAAGGAVGANLFVGGLGAGILSALVIAFLTRNERLKEDTAVGLVFVTMFALGIAIISTQGSYSIDLAHILFGSINGISQSDLEIMAALGVVVLLVIGVFYKQFLIISFDLSLAYTLKLPVEGLRVLLLVLIAVTIVASLQAVGIALMLALLITPAATARLLTHRLHHMILTAASVGILSGIAGFYLSYYLDVPSGASIVLTMSALFALVFALKSMHTVEAVTGEVVATAAEIITAYEEPEDEDASVPRPALAIAGGYAYVSDPIAGTLHIISLSDMSEVAVMELGVHVTSIAVLGANSETGSGI